MSDEAEHWYAVGCTEGKTCPTDGRDYRAKMPARRADMFRCGSGKRIPCPGCGHVTRCVRRGPISEEEAGELPEWI